MLFRSIHSCKIVTDADLVAHQSYEIELADADHLNRLLRAIKNIDGVYEARRGDSDA